MKFTDEERKEVAKKLRDKHKERNKPLFFEPQDMGIQAFNYLKDLQSCLPDADSTFIVIADLIEPEPELTCEPREQWEDDDTLPYLACSNCGEPLKHKETKTFENEYELCPYCVYCGAKVVE